MIDSLPTYIPIVFIITTVITLLIFYWVIRSSEKDVGLKYSGKIVVTLIIWINLQGVISITDVYNLDTNFLPPKIFLFGVLPTILVILYLFISKTGHRFIDRLELEKLTYLNLVRIPVEYVLFWLFLNGAIPQILTFEGWNFDIIMGITAPVIIYYGFMKKSLSKQLILLWNIIGFLLLIFVFGMAFLSAPFPLQQLAFDQPNIGLLHFPYVLLPTFIVPVVILGHLISIRQLVQKIKLK